MEAYLEFDEKEIVGEVLQGFYIYLDREGEKVERTVKTYWWVMTQYGSLGNAMAAIGALLYLILGDPTQRYDYAYGSGKILKRVLELA